jgi:uncharacterized RDD family membrane protein YckC
MKASVLHRVCAKAVDLMVVLACCAQHIIPYPVGPLLGFFYSLGADSLKLGSHQSQSLGKKFFRLQVVSRVRQGSNGLREPCNLKESIYRNAPVGVATFFGLIPVWGWLILFVIGVPLMVMEIYLMLSVETGHRLGDVMGDTEVISSKAA